MSNLLKHCLKGFAAAAVVLATFACGDPSRPQDTSSTLEKPFVRIGVGGQSQFIYLPLTLAQQLGYFKELGLTVEIFDLKGGSEALAALAGGSVDVVTGFYEHTIRTQVRGKLLKMFILFDRYPGMVLMVGRKHVERVRSIRDLAGHPVGVTAPGSSTDAMVKYLLKQNGLDPQAIPVVAAGTTTMIAAIAQERVWAGVTVDPIAFKMENDGIAVPLYDTRTAEGSRQVFGGVWPAGGFYSSDEFIKQNPHTVLALAKAGIKTLRYIHSHSAEEIALQVPESFLAGSKDRYVASLKANLGMFSQDGLMPPEGPPNVMKTLQLVDPRITPEVVDLEKTYDNSFVRKAN
jgi:sulfonate transport system substrate-binding protein